MVVDIRYTDKGPEQFQRIRMITFYPHRSGKAPREIVFHLDDNAGQHNVPVKNIESVTVTRD